MSSHALRDKDYDLVSTIYHAAYGEDLCRQYMEDAEKRATTMLLNFSKSLRKGTEPTNGQKRQRNAEETTVISNTPLPFMEGEILNKNRIYIPIFGLSIILHKLLLTKQQHRYITQPHHLRGITAHQKLTDTGVAISPHYQ